MGKLNIDLKKDLSIFKKTLVFVWQSSPNLTIIRLALILFQAILPLIPLYLIKLLIDQVAMDISGGIKEAWWILLAFGIVQLLIIFFENVASYITSIQGDKVSDHMSSLVLEKSIELDLAHYDSDKFHDTYHRAQLQAGHRPISLLNAITNLILSTIMLLALGGLLMTLHWAIGLVMIGMVLPIAFVQLKYTRVIFKWKEKTTPTERRANYIRFVLSSIPYAKEVRLFAFGPTLKKRFDNIRKRLLQEKKQLYLRQNLSLSLVQIIEAIATIGVLIFIILRAIGGIITIGDIVMYFQAFQKGQSSIHKFLKSGVSLYDNRLFLTHIFRFLEIRSFINDPEEPLKWDQSISSIELENVSFSYPETNTEVLSDINLEFKKGQITAIVGENGSGKTTMVKLLNRLYDPTIGAIKINGKNINNYKVVDLRDKITVIFQDFSRYHFTASQNIEISNMSEIKDKEKIKESAQLAGADEFIMELDDQYNHQLGRSFIRGQELSGGQWQKIALARAFYKEAEVIILDEPTSFIDPLAEADIFSKLRSMAKDKILILVTHRIYNLKTSDQIVVLDKGQILEQGNHNELMGLGGKYAKMFESQK